MFNSVHLWSYESEKLGINDKNKPNTWVWGIIKEVEIQTSFNGYNFCFDILIPKDTAYNNKDVIVKLNSGRELYEYDSRKFKKLQEQQGFINDIAVSLKWRQDNNEKTIEKLTKLIKKD